MIDLEHQSLTDGIAPDPTAKDARGWCQLELRADGSLWAVNVTWTDDGAARLRGKRQRYVSPAFSVDLETNRITQIINVAITAIPATHDTPALVAATKNVAALAAAGDSCMTPEQVKKALDAVEKNDANAALEILKGLIASAASGDEGTPPPGESAPEPPLDPAKMAAPAAAAPGDEEKKKEDEQLRAAARIALAITGKTDIGQAMSELTRVASLARDLETREEALAKDRATIEGTERRSLVAQLVKLGVEIPATAWSDDKGTVPVARLANEPIESLRDRVQKLTAARGSSNRSPILPPTGARPPAVVEQDQEIETPHGTITISPREVATCKAVGADLQIYASNKAFTQKNRAAAR